MLNHNQSDFKPLGGGGAMRPSRIFSCSSLCFSSLRWVLNFFLSFLVRTTASGAACLLSPGDMRTGEQLTKEQKTEKKIAKLTEDTTDGVHVTVFK